METATEYTWTIADIKDETATVKSLYLTPPAQWPGFIAGQYLTVKLPGFSPVEGKAYSISSMPSDATVRLTVKRIGTFSQAILSKKIGDTLISTAPYGFFYPEPEDTSTLIFIVGGIGITPCLSIIKDLVYRKDTRQLRLHYSNQTEADIAFLGELNELASLHPSLQIRQYITREKGESGQYTYTRITTPDILSSLDSPSDAEFFICGSMDFTKSLWKDLYSAGVAQHQLYTEGFF